MDARRRGQGKAGMLTEPSVRPQVDRPKMKVRTPKETSDDIRELPSLPKKGQPVVELCRSVTLSFDTLDPLLASYSFIS